MYLQFAAVLASRYGSYALCSTLTGMRWAWVYFLGLTLLVVLPWFLQPGFLFLLDFVWPPTLTPPSTWWVTPSLSTVPYEWLWWLFSFVVPTAVLQKVVFSLPFFIAGLAMFQLLRWLLHRWSSEQVFLPALTAGTFYAFNSFVVTRVFMGQFYLLLAYALTPWAVLFFLRFLATPRWQQGLRAAFFLLLVFITNSHQIFLLPLFLVFFLRRRHFTHPAWKGWVVFLFPVVCFVFVSWLVSHRAGAGHLDPRGPWARALQPPYSGHFFVDVALLTATWKTDLPFFFPAERLVGFGGAMALLLLVMTRGIVYWRRNVMAWSVLMASVGAGLLAGLLAVGVAHPLTEPPAAWLYQHVPFWLGLRDSAKWLTIVALAESILLGAGVAVLPRRLSLGLVFLTIYLTVPTWRGFSGQLLPAQYPDSWREAQVVLAQQGASQRVLFLPWHQYLPFSFSDERTIDNPARRFFGGVELISGDNSEVGGTGGRPYIYSESTRPLSKAIETLLRQASGRTDFGEQLASDNIRFVMLARDTLDADSYVWLHNQRDLHLIFESPELFIWEKKAF